MGRRNERFTRYTYAWSGDECGDCFGGGLVYVEEDMTIDCPICKDKTAVKKPYVELSGGANNEPIIEVSIYECPVCYWVKREVKEEG